MLRSIFSTCVAASLTLAIHTSLEAASTKSQCLDGKQEALKTGGFSGPMLCDSKAVSFKLAGTLAEKKQRYLIYDYKYRFKPSGGHVLHGGQRVVVLSANGKYLGQYALAPPQQLAVVVKGPTIAIGIGPEIKGVIEFKNGPPSSAYVDGERLAFFK